MPFTFNFGGFNPGDFGQGGERPQRERKPRKPIGTPVTRTLINIAVTALVGLVYFYVELPALNPHAEEFYFFVFLLCAVYCGCAVHPNPPLPHLSALSLPAFDEPLKAGQIGRAHV